MALLTPIQGGGEESEVQAVGNIMSVSYLCLSCVKNQAKGVVNAALV